MLKKYRILFFILILLTIEAPFSRADYPMFDNAFGVHLLSQGYPNILGCQDNDMGCIAQRPNSTIGRLGCALTAMAMVYKSYGFQTIPSELHYPTTRKLDPGTFNNYLAGQVNSTYPLPSIGGVGTRGFAWNYDLDWWKTTSNFYYSSYAYHYVVPNYDCSPIINVQSASCFMMTWPTDPEIAGLSAIILLNNDILHLTPDIMKIHYTSFNTEGVPRDRTHFVVIGGYDTSYSGDGGYRAYNPGFGNDQLDYKSNLTWWGWTPTALNSPQQYGKKYTDGDPMFAFEGMRTLYRFTDGYSSTLLDTSRADIAVFSPVEIQVIDPEGKKIGYNPDTGNKILENPMSLYYNETPVTPLDGSDTSSEPYKRLIIIQPKQGNYIFKMFGTGDGPYTINMEWTKSDGTPNLVTSLTGTATSSLFETYRVAYSPTGEATLSQTNQVPIANAGSNQTGEQSYEITLDGFASSDPDGDPMTYTWSYTSKPEGSLATLSNANAVKPTFTPDKAGTYVLQLVVNDHFTDSAPSTVTITATPVKSRISVTPNFSTPLSAGAGYISFDVNNIGRIGVNSGIISVSLADPDGAVVYSGNQTFSSGVGGSMTVSVPVTIPPLKFGNYTLTYTQSDETRTGSSATATILNSIIATFSFDKTSYRVRETADVSLQLTNTGKFNQDNIAVTISMLDAGYMEAKSISLNVNTNATVLHYAVPIPAAISAGQHDVYATLALGGTQIIQTAKIAVPQSSLNVSYAGPTTLAVGDLLSVILENTGGVDATYSTDKLTIIDSSGVIIYKGSMIGEVLSGKKKTVTVAQIPSQTTSGTANVDITLKDVTTGKTSELQTAVTLNGLSGELIARTDKDIYLNTESITARSTITNGAFDIENGLLDKKVIRYQDTTKQKFTHFLPKPGFPFVRPAAAAVGPDGSVYVADWNCIQKFDSNGNFITKWGSNGSGNGQLLYPSGIAVSSDGYIYVAESYNNRVQKFDSSGNFIAKWGSYGNGDSQFKSPSGIAAGSDGRIYVADSENSRIQVFDNTGNFITKWGNGLFSDPYGITVATDGTIYVSDRSGNCIFKFDSMGQYISKWGSSGSGNGQFSGPYDLVATDGFVYVIDRFNNRVQKFNSSGAFITKWGSFGSGDGQFYYPYGITVGLDGSVYVVDTSNKRIQKFTGDGTFIMKWGGDGSADGQLNTPHDIAIDTTGAIYVADTGNNRIQKFQNDGTFITKWGSYGSGMGQFQGEYGIAVDSDGYVYVADTYNNRIQKFDNEGNFIKMWGSSGNGYGQFSYPYGIAAGPDGSIYVADTSNNRIQKFDSDGTFIASWGSYGTGNGQFYNPNDLVVATDGFVYVADTYNNRIQKFDYYGTYVTKWTSSQPTSVAVGPNGFIYVLDAGNDWVNKFRDDGTFIEKWGSYGSGEGQFYWPCGIVVDKNGAVYVADTNNNRIERMVLIKTKEILFSATEHVKSFV